LSNTLSLPSPLKGEGKIGYPWQENKEAKIIEKNKSD